MNSRALTAYTGRFAPSPTGPLHAGSLVAALASWLDARAHGGRWLVRIDDVDTPRCMPDADRTILEQLARCGLESDAPVVWQSQHVAHYEAALERLVQRGLAYPCLCSRKTIAQALAHTGTERERHGELVYYGSCRQRAATEAPPHAAWRLNVDAAFEFSEPNPALALAVVARAATIFIADQRSLRWQDRSLGWQVQNIGREVGDFVLRRADGLWAYQLAVVIDDDAQGVTHVVRGQDLADNTPRQILLQHSLGLSTPQYLHTPLVRAPNGEKLSKQNGAQALDLSDPARALRQAAQVLGLRDAPDSDIATMLRQWTQQWDRLYHGGPLNTY